MPLWRVEYVDRAQRVLQKLEKPVRERIEAYIASILDCPDPRSREKPLTGPRAGQWRYRVGDYRVLCELRDEVLVILVLEVDHRSRVYRNR